MTSTIPTAEPTYSCERHTAEAFVFKIGMDYAVFTVMSRGAGYHMLAIESSYGGYAYAFGSPGNCFYRFLARLNRDYIVGKLTSGEPEEFDAEATTDELRKLIIADRRRGDLDASQARAEWLLLDELESDGSQSGFDQWGRETDYFGDGWWEHAVSMPGPRARECSALYDKFWPAFAAELLKAAPAEMPSVEAAS